MCPHSLLDFVAVVYPETPQDVDEGTHRPDGAIYDSEHLRILCPDEKVVANDLNGVDYELDGEEVEQNEAEHGRSLLEGIVVFVHDPPDGKTQDDEHYSYEEEATRQQPPLVSSIFIDASHGATKAGYLPLRHHSRLYII